MDPYDYKADDDFDDRRVLALVSVETGLVEYIDAETGDLVGPIF